MPRHTNRLALIALLAASGLATACPPDSIAAPAIATPAIANDPWAGGPAIYPPAPACLADTTIIQLAILLDTSGSMEGLINQARARIWDVVNDLNKAHRDGRRAKLEVALYQYGSGELPSSEGFLTLVQPFTTDLDLLSERLFSLRVTGQSEYCGWAIQSALQQLSWDTTPTTTPLTQQPLRVIVIAGNEPFTQGPVSYREAIRPACERGVIVNTVYCGESDEGTGSGWAQGAHLGKGAYLSINHHRAIPVVRCPQDDDIARLNDQLNGTYIPFGVRGQQFKDRQEMQDSLNSALSPSGAVARAASKASAAYTNSHWDLIDAIRDNTTTLEAVATEDLPASLRTMTLDQRKSELDRLTRERESIQSRIRTLAAERERFLVDHRERHQSADTLDSAMIRAMREQARRLGFRFE